MRDPVMEALAEEQARMDVYERRCPICDECGEPITADDWYWGIYDNILCESCLLKFRKSIESYIEGGGA
jgi:formylmethanofuran dehydrogenase subunit E